MSCDSIHGIRPSALAVSAMLLVLTGCTAPLTNQVERAIEHAHGRSTELAGQLKQGRARVASESHSAIERVEGIWLPFKRLSEVSEKASAKEAAGRYEAHCH